MVNGMIPDNFICKFKSNQEKIISNDKKFVEDTQVDSFIHSFIHSFIQEREREREREEKKHPQKKRNTASCHSTNHEHFKYC